MKILKVLSLLLDYPTDELFVGGNLDACKSVVDEATVITAEVKQQLTELIDDLQTVGTIEAQARYDGWFERGRSLSLWLFEHVHGESRDRGQAMVDLMNQYAEAGFEIGIKELPDFLPLYLEFLSYKASIIDDDVQIRMDIADVSHIVALLAARLKERGSIYEGCMNALLEIAGKPLSVVEEYHTQVTTEIADNSKDMLDKEWEEEVVDFLSAEQESRCSSSVMNTNKQAGDDVSYAQKHEVISKKEVDVPVHWVDFTQSQKQPSTNKTPFTDKTVDKQEVRGV